jgi:hypothetical protein
MVAADPFVEVGACGCPPAERDDAGEAAGRRHAGTNHPCGRSKNPWRPFIDRWIERLDVAQQPGPAARRIVAEVVMANREAFRQCLADRVRCTRKSEGTGVNRSPCCSASTRIRLISECEPWPHFAMRVGWNERPESALHYAVSSFPEKKRWWSRNIRTVMMIVIEMPVATTTRVATMMTMVVSDISIMVVEACPCASGFRQGVCDLTEYGARCGRRGSSVTSAICGKPAGAWGRPIGSPLAG